MANLIRAGFTPKAARDIAVALTHNEQVAIGPFTLTQHDSTTHPTGDTAA